MLQAIVISILAGLAVSAARPMVGTCKAACVERDGQLDCQRLLGVSLIKTQCCVEAGGEYFFTRHGVERCEQCETCENAPRVQVCATNGVTYDSECALRRAACRNPHLNILKNHIGQCQPSCDTVRCEGNDKCAYDERGRPRCVSLRCDEKASDEAVCGSNGVTYPNECALLNAWTQNDRYLAIAYRGQCKENVTCSALKCHKKSYSVRMARNSWMMPKMVCVVNRSSNTPRCVETIVSDCERSRKVCGSDGHVYDNYCQLLQQMEYERTLIDALPMEMCNILF